MIYIIREEFALSLKYMKDLFIIGIFNAHIYIGPTCILKKFNFVLLKFNFLYF